MSSRLTLVPALLLAACAAGATQPGVVPVDPGFDWWCGDVPCAWTVDEGSVRRVATWHERDYGVELVGAPVVLHQDVELTEPSCLRFVLVADVAEDAQVSVEVDAGIDGVVDETVPLPSAAWQPLTLVASRAVAPGLVRYVLRRIGPGRAVLADIVVDARRCL